MDSVRGVRTQPESSSTQTSHSKSNIVLGNLFKEQEDLIKEDCAHLPSTQGLMMKSDTMGTTSPGLSGKKHGDPP
jgi:hypothetical protein